MGFGVGVLVTLSVEWMSLCIMVSTPPFGVLVEVYCLCLLVVVLFVLVYRILYYGKLLSIYAVDLCLGILVSCSSMMVGLFWSELIIPIMPGRLELMCPVFRVMMWVLKVVT